MHGMSQGGYSGTKPNQKSCSLHLNANAGAARLMALYRVHFVDHGGNVYSTHEIEHDADEDAIEAAHGMDVRFIGAGFDLREGERLVHRHRN